MAASDAARGSAGSGLAAEPSSFPSALEARDSPLSSVMPTSRLMKVGSHNLVKAVPREPLYESHMSVVVVRGAIRWQVDDIYTVLLSSTEDCKRLARFALQLELRMARKVATVDFNSCRSSAQNQHFNNVATFAGAGRQQLIQQLQVGREFNSCQQLQAGRAGPQPAAARPAVALGAAGP